MDGALKNCTEGKACSKILSQPIISYMHVTVSAKTDQVCTKTEVHFVAQDHKNYKNYLYSVSLLANVNKSALLEGILPTM